MTAAGTIERFRLFVAITVPEPVRKEVLRAQRELQPLAPHGAIRWTNPEQFHLTLRFLGGIAPDCLTGLQESVRAVCAGVSMLHLRAQGVGFFSHGRSQRVTWIGIADDENRLAEVQRKVEQAVQPFTAEPSGERFTGHVTLGRFKAFRRQEIRELVDRVETMKDRVFGEWTAREIEIIRSELLPNGARYTSLAACPLGRIEPG